MIIFGIREKCEPGEGQHLDSQHSVQKRIVRKNHNDSNNHMLKKASLFGFGKDKLWLIMYQSWEHLFTSHAC